MAKKWEDMTREEKREERFKRWLSPPRVKFVSEEAAQDYKKRVSRLAAAIRLKKPDRVPVTLPVGNFPAYYAGYSLHTVMYDYEKLRQSWTSFARAGFDMDSFTGPNLVYSGRAYETLGYKLYQWPGHGLGTDVNAYQFVEGEYMRADEYDALIKDPSDFAVRVIMPRAIGALEPLKNLPPLASLLGMPIRFVAPTQRADVRAAFRALVAAGREMAKWQKQINSCNREILSLGYTSMRGGMGVAPFDVIGDSLRGTQGSMLDMYRQPDKLLEALDVITRITIDSTLSAVEASGGFMVSFPLHKGDDTFMNARQFDTFYWPSLKKVIMALINEGIMVMLFAEGRYQTRLETIKDLPKGWVMWQFDQTDMATAKKVLGDTACIAGNVPSSLMCTGTPRAVKEYCRKLIEVCAPGGGYILTGGASATETNPENLRAMVDAAKEYGVYR